MGLWLPRGPCVAAVVLMLMVLSRPVALVRDPQSRFLLQLKAECRYLNGRERVRSVTRFIYNQEEFARFDSDVGKFLAVTELGQPIAEDLNSQKDVLDNYRASVDRLDLPDPGDAGDGGACQPDQPCHSEVEGAVHVSTEQDAEWSCGRCAGSAVLCRGAVHLLQEPTGKEPGGGP
uniref:Histocompatibility 2, class II antigen E beta2 n=1 Tax=Peromyscus maniculatus bairdii TaxID=230844 RepID=A0A8C8UHY7_PERMB